MSKTPDEITTLTWWLNDAASILRQNGTTTHADKVKEAAAAFTVERAAREKADLALQAISLTLGGTDEWTEQGQMILDVQRQVAACKEAREKAEAMVKRLGQRIHNQRRSLRDNWQIVENRRKWLVSDTSRHLVLRHIARAKAATARAEKAEAERDVAVGLLAKEGQRTGEAMARAERAEAERDALMKRINHGDEAGPCYSSDDDPNCPLEHLFAKELDAIADRIRAETIKECAAELHRLGYHASTIAAIRALGDKP